MTDSEAATVRQVLTLAYASWRLRRPLYNPWRFTGQEWIEGLNLHNYKNRFYSDDLGRFLQQDPIRFDAGDLNLYRYCGNNSINRTDPEGLEEVDVTLRAFIPQQSVGGFGGDGRSFSSDPKASSRVSVSARIETDPTKNNGNPLIASSWKVQATHLNATGGERVSNGPKTPAVKVTRDKKGNVNINVQMNMRNPYTPVGSGIRTDMNLSVNPSASKVEAHGTLSGSPAFEANVTTKDQVTNIPLQDAGKNFIDFAVGLQKTEQVDSVAKLKEDPKK